MTTGPSVTAYGSHLQANKGDEEEGRCTEYKGGETQQICSRESTGTMAGNKSQTRRMGSSHDNLHNSAKLSQYLRKALKGWWVGRA